MIKTAIALAVVVAVSHQALAEVQITPHYSEPVYTPTKKPSEDWITTTDINVVLAEALEGNCKAATRLQDMVGGKPYEIGEPEQMTAERYMWWHFHGCVCGLTRNFAPGTGPSQTKIPLPEEVRWKAADKARDWAKYIVRKVPLTGLRLPC